MPRILTVDDSSAVRAIITRQLHELGFELHEAEDGQQALEKIQGLEVDLILLDVTMPVMDGTAMLTRLREAGNKTPVIMLTSESKRSVVAEAMRLGIDDYILKPFAPEELLKKVRAALRPCAEPAPLPGPATTNSRPAVKSLCDVLIIDDMDNVAKRLRQLLPHLKVESQTKASGALAALQQQEFRTILVDAELPDVDMTVLVGQIRLLQPQAAVVALALKTGADEATALAAQGFSDVLHKPFTPESIQDFILKYFDREELVTREENVVKVSGCAGRGDHMDRYFDRLHALMPAAIDQVANACFDRVVIDLSRATPEAARLPRLIVDLALHCQPIGLPMTLVAPSTLRRLLSDFDETKTIVIHSSIEEALKPAA